VVTALGERYRSITPDIRGHGAAAGEVPVTLEAVVGDLARLAGRGPTILAGYSMGGRIALHCALAWPALIERLVLISASPGIADPGERSARQQDDERLADEIEASRIEEFALRWAGTPVLAGLADDTLARVHADRLRNHPAGLARALRGLGTGALPSLWGRLTELPMPLTLVVGERDGKFRQIAERMRESISDCKLVVVPGAGHAVHLQAPGRVAEAIAGRAG
jgi:2-succinyl-6-hydroxy-2,4-cyclohexadiene-1-carboxylate synthase